MENTSEIKQGCKVKMLCYFAFLQLGITALAFIGLLYFVFSTGKHVLISPNGIQQGYFAELPESVQAKEWVDSLNQAEEALSKQGKNKKEGKK